MDLSRSQRICLGPRGPARRWRARSFVPVVRPAKHRVKMSRLKIRTMPSRASAPHVEKPISVGPSQRIDPWVEKLAWIMDNSIPIGRWSIGLDGLLGLIPGVGDFLGTVVSALIVSRAAMAGLPRVTIARMVGNVAID